MIQAPFIFCAIIGLALVVLFVMMRSAYQEGENTLKGLPPKKPAAQAYSEMIDFVMGCKRIDDLERIYPKINHFRTDYYRHIPTTEIDAFCYDIIELKNIRRAEMRAELVDARGLFPSTYPSS